MYDRQWESIYDQICVCVCVSVWREIDRKKRKKDSFAKVYAEIH